MSDVPPDMPQETEAAGSAPAPQQEPELPPFVIEGARSSRSKCKTCRRKIDKGVLRIGIRVEGPYGVGHMWHHLTCAARRRFDDVAEAYRLEAWKEAKEPPAEVPPLEKLEAQKEKAEEKRRTRKQIPYVEVDPSGRAKCKHCGEPLEKGKLRVVLGREVTFGEQVRMSPVNVHPHCVAAELEHEESGVEAAGLVNALRANSEEIDEAAFDEAVAAMGDLRA